MEQVFSQFGLDMNHFHVHYFYHYNIIFETLDLFNALSTYCAILTTETVTLSCEAINKNSSRLSRKVSSSPAGTSGELTSPIHLVSGPVKLSVRVPGRISRLSSFAAAPPDDRVPWGPVASLLISRTSAQWGLYHETTGRGDTPELPRKRMTLM